jgi:hypothetical protein
MLLIPVLNPPPRARKKKGKKVATKKKSRRRGGSRYVGGGRVSSSGKRPISWTESAHAAGAVHSSGRKRGKIMSKPEALMARIKVPGHISQRMISFWLAEGSHNRKGSKAYKAALAKLKKMAAGQKTKRKKRAVSYMRKPKAKRSKGRVVKKGKRKGQRVGNRRSTKTSSGRYKRGLGPTTTITLKRGLAPTKAQIKYLKEGGFLSALQAPGGVVKLNRKKRRKRKNPRRRPAKKNARKKKARRRSKKKSSSRRRRKSRVKSNPKRKAKAKSNPKRRRRRKSSSRKRRRSTKRNPGRKLARRRRSRKGRVRRNPGIVATLRSSLMKITEGDLWVTSAHILAGATVTAGVCETAARQRWVPAVLKRGAGEVALCALSSGLVYGGARIAERYLPKGKLTKNLSMNMLVGGIVYTSVKAASVFLPRLASKLGLTTNRRSMASGQAGMADWLELQGMGGTGMGSAARAVRRFPSRTCAVTPASTAWVA